MFLRDHVMRFVSAVAIGTFDVVIDYSTSMYVCMYVCMYNIMYWMYSKKYACTYIYNYAYILSTVQSIFLIFLL